MITAEQIAGATGATVPLAQQWLPALEAAMERWGITTPARQAAFLSQVSVESARLTRLVESLDYSAEALVRTWPLRFSAELAQQVGRTADHSADQRRIANIAYGGRYGNGDEASGDGWMYRGRGLLQVTFRANYRAAGAGIGQDLLTHPELLTKQRYAAEAAAWFWQAHGCNALADAGDIHGISLRINGGTNGLEERVAMWNTAKQVLA